MFLSKIISAIYYLCIFYLIITSSFRVLVENGVKLSLTVIDTPGFGEAVDNTECWAPILEYVEDRFDAYLEAETRVERVDIRDNRSEEILETFSFY